MSNKNLLKAEPLKVEVKDCIPQNRRILVELGEKISKIGSLYVPEGEQKRPANGKILAVDPTLEHLTVGHYALYYPGSGIEMVLNQKDVLLLHANEVLVTYDEIASQ